MTCSDVLEALCLTPESMSIGSKRIQKDVSARYVTQRPMDSGSNVLSFLSNVQPQYTLNALQNGALLPRNYLLSIVNLSEGAFRRETIVSQPSNPNSIASHDYNQADDYINSMSQFKTSTIKSHSDPDYAPLLKPIRNPEPIQFIAEPQAIPTIIDVSINDSNYIFSSQSESELAAKESTPFILRLNTFEDEDDDYTSPCGLTTFNVSRDSSNDFTLSLDGSNISDATSVAQNLTPLCKSSQLLDKINCQYQKQ